MFSGSIVAIVTPMHEDTSVDYDALSGLLNFHIDNGTNGIVSVGTTGESATLSHCEHQEVISFMVKESAGRIPIIAGTGSNSTQEAIELTQHARDAGVDACLLVTPYYNKPSQKGLYEHFKAVAEAVDIPIILYNVPSRTCCDMLPETVIKLSHINNIIGIKEATGIVSRVAEIKSGMQADFVLLSGDDPTAAEFILQGGVGNICVTANIAPKQISELYRHALAGDRDAVEKTEAPLVGLYSEMFCETNPQPVKWALARMGRIKPYARLPLVELDEQYHAQVEHAMHQAGLLAD